MRSRWSVLAMFFILAGCAGSQQSKYYFNQGDYNASARGLSGLAGSGDPVAQMDLGYLYEHGLGVKQDRDKAIALYQQAAAQGLVRADTCLAVLFIMGHTGDFYRGLALLRQADAAGDTYASYDLGYLYEIGWGVTKDADEAARLKAKAGDEIGHVYEKYAGAMRANIAANQHYPATAVSGGYGGIVTVQFTIQAPYAKDAKIERSSGHADLDDAAIAAVYQTYYPTMPPGVMPPLNFDVAINFHH